jgi:methylenetetrahydrofolate dehydrogenase (NADP+)/methenyltetrahydrofolate cyclohydrolase
MVAKVIDGHAVARQVREECRQQTLALAAQGVVPGLAVIIVGDDPASRVYVANKIKACTEVGLKSTVYAFAADTPDAEVEAKILSV